MAFTAPQSGTRSPKIQTTAVVYSIITLSDIVFCFVLVSLQYNGGLLPDIILLTLCDYIGVNTM